MWRNMSCVFLAAICLTSLGMATGDTILVHDSAGFDDALDTAQPGDVVLLQPGTYTGGLFAAGVTGVTIRSQDPANPAVIDATGESNGLQLSDAVDVTLQDLVIQNASSNGLNIDDGGSFASPSRNITLRNLTIQNIGSTSNQDGIKLSGVVGFHIDSVRVLNWGGGGSAVDMVGSHRGLIENSLFEHDNIGIGGSGIRPKGGSKDVTIRANRIVLPDGLGRAIQFGGSTDEQFFRYIDGDSGYEADRITAEGNVVLGGRASFSFSVIDGGVYHHNLAVQPNRWIIRILNENPDLAVDTSNGVFHDNVIVFDDQLSTTVNVGSNTQPETFSFAGNQWYNTQTPANSTPNLPTTEIDPIVGVEPTIDADQPIAWPFNWGQWLVNANTQAGQVIVTDPVSLMLVVPRDASARFEPTLSQPLIGSWDWFELDQEELTENESAATADATLGGIASGVASIDLAGFSQVILVNPAVVQRPGDANRDGHVTFADFSILQNNFNMTGSFEDGDFNGDGVVSFADFAILQNELGLTLTPGFTPGQTLAPTLDVDHPPQHTTTLIVPAPGTRAVLTLPLLGLWLVVRRRKSHVIH